MKETKFGFGAGFDRYGMELSSIEVGKLNDRLVFHATLEFGGCFLAKGLGGWIDPASGEYIPEPGYVLSVYGIPDYDHAKNFAFHILRLYNQKSVLLVWDGEGEFIDSQSEEDR